MTSDAAALPAPLPLVAAEPVADAYLHAALTAGVAPASDGAVPGACDQLRRATDLALVLLLAAPALAVVALAALAVKATSRGPAFYTQARLGRGGRPFTLVKLRSMRHRCEAATGPRWATPGDARVTPVGRLLRATHIDELPQLWNVLRGDMGLVGPRPERPEIVEGMQLGRLVPGYGARLLVRPGVTGLAQVCLPPDTSVESVRRKVALDLWYVANRGPWLDLRILAATAFKLVGLGTLGARVLARGGEDGPAPRPAPQETWRAALAERLAEPAPAEPGEQAALRAWFRTTAAPALELVAAELRGHGRTVRVTPGGPAEIGLRVWDEYGRRELDLKLRARGVARPRVYARVLVREGRRDFVHEHHLDRPPGELTTAEVIAFVVSLYRAGSGTPVPAPTSAARRP